MQIFYPSHQPRLIQTRDGRQLDVRTARVTVAEIPYVRLRDKLFGSQPTSPTGFDQVIAHAQQTVDLLPNAAVLLIVPKNRRPYIGKVGIPLRPTELVPYTQLALARVQQGQGGDGFLSLYDIEVLQDEVLRRCEQMYGRDSGRVDALRRYCPSVTLIDRFKHREPVCQLVKLINKRCRHARRQQLVGRPHMAGPSRCHGRRARLPASRRSHTAGGLDHRQCLPQAVMGQHHMCVRQRQPQLFF
jgi:hypothetical protein